MIGGRQLPSWMLKSNASDKGSVSEVKEVNENAGTEPVDKKACKRQRAIQRKQKDHDSVPEIKEVNKEGGAEQVEKKVSERQRKIQRKENDAGVTVLKNKSHLLKKCKARSKRKLTKQDKVQGVAGDESDEEKKVSIMDGKRSEQGDEEELLNKCGKIRRKRMSSKQRCDQSNDFYEVGMEDEVDVAERKGRRSNAPRRNKRKEKDFMERSCDGLMESIASDDEITVEDLISIAEEYVNAEKEKELKKLKNVRVESDAKALHTASSKIGSDKSLTTNMDDRIFFTDKPLSIDATVTKPTHAGGSITNPIGTGDAARDMLDLFLGPLLKTS